MDILIYAKPEVIEHKMKDKIGFAGCDFCYWIGKVPAIKNFYKINKIYFSNGKKIYAEGKFQPTITDDENLLCFSPLKRINKKQPKKPSTRGWCYINR